MLNIQQDVLYAWRAMRKNPGFALTAIFTLALGIGGNATIFTVIRSVLLKPLAWREPDRLVRVTRTGTQRADQDTYLSLGRYENLRAQVRSFSAFGAAFVATEDMTLSGKGEPEAVKGARVSGNFLSVLGAEPLLGRSFLPEEDRRGGASVALISAALWKRRFGGDPAIAGRTAVLNAAACTIIGVLPAGFDFPLPDVDVWVTRPAEFSGVPSQAWDIVPVLSGIARLKPGVSLEQARAELNVVNNAFNAAHPDLRDADRRAAIKAMWLRDQVVANVRPMLWTLFGAVGFVLLIACANVASLLLARATSRGREFALRAALGAPRSRLVSQLLAESLALSAAGGALGIVLAKWGLRAITRMTSFHLPRSGEIRLDALVLAFTIALSVLTGVLFGLFPALHASRPDLAGVLRESCASAGRASGRRGLFGGGTRGLLVVAQVALSIVLLIGAALLLQSFARLRSVNPGFEPAHLLSMRIALPPARYDTGAKRLAFFQDLTQRVAALPGVRGVTIAQTLPTLSPRYASPMQIVEQPAVPPGERPQGLLQSVMPGYFRTLGIPLRRGREFSERENARGATPTVVVNESLARRFWPAWPRGENPVGQHLVLGNQTQDRGFEIIGIAADVHEVGLSAESGPEIYLPTLFRPQQTVDLGVRTSGNPMGMVAAVRAQVAAIDRDQPVSDIQAMETAIDESLGQRRLTLLLLALFAGVALVLAMLGIYGAIAYSVLQRTQELGIRRALGAQHRDILSLVLRQGLTLAGAGVAIGCGGAFALTRLMKTLLFQVNAADPATYVGVALVFVTVAMVASYVPARRASKVDPMAALR